MSLIVPRVTVLMPVFNAGKFLHESIQSILCQTYQSFRFLIINDGSTDNSFEILQSYIDDSRIQIISLSENRGLIYCLNLGLKLIKSEFIVRMDADDISHLDRIKLLVKVLDDYPQVGICGTRVGQFKSIIIDHIPLVSNKVIRSVHLFNCPITHASAIYRKSIIDDKSIKYNSKYIHAEDNDFITNILSCSEGRIIDCDLYWVRKHESQVSHKFRSLQIDNSTLRRVEFLNTFYTFSFSPQEIILYKGLSYKLRDLSLSDFEQLGLLVKKFELLMLREECQVLDKCFFFNILYSRVEILYLNNSRLGFPLLINYIYNFFFHRKIKVLPNLFKRILYGV